MKCLFLNRIIKFNFLSSESNTLKCSFMNAFVPSHSDYKRLMNTPDLIKADTVLQNIFTLVSYL